MNQLKIVTKLVVLLLVVQAVTVSVGASAANTISGRVTNKNGDPIADIEVIADPVEFYGSYVETYTNENGEYTLTVQGGLYHLKFADSLELNPNDPVFYLSRWYGEGQQNGESGPDNREQILVENNNLSNMDVVMDRASVVAGTIQFGDNINADSIYEVYVHAYNTPYTPDLWVPRTSDRIIVEDGDRTWRINNLPAGTYRICALYYYLDNWRNVLFDCYGGDSVEQATDVEIGHQTDLTNLTITIDSERLTEEEIVGRLYLPLITH